MLVVLDATAFVADFLMTGNAWRIFLGGFQRAGLQPCLVESVQDEVVNKYREEIESLANKAEKLAHEARRMLGTRVNHGFPSTATVDLMVSSYSAKLISLTVDHDFTHLPYPKASHKEVVARALRRRRPFRENGTGYRDALLWSSILERVREQPQQPVAVVTANTHDFGAEALHPDLLADIERPFRAPPRGGPGLSRVETRKSSEMKGVAMNR